MTRKFTEPNRHDPLSENAMNRRVWAAYLRAGYDRGSFAKAMGVKYNQVHYWDVGSSTMGLGYLCQASTLVGYTLDELVFGHAAKSRPTHQEAALSQDAIRALLLAINASTEQITALGEHQESPAGRLQPMTRTYVVSFVSTYAAAVDSGRKHEQAIKAAMVEAVNARAAVAAVSSGRTPLPVDGSNGKRAPKVTKRRKAPRVPVERPKEN